MGPDHRVKPYTLSFIWRRCSGAGPEGSPQAWEANPPRESTAKPLMKVRFLAFGVVFFCLFFGFVLSHKFRILRWFLHLF